ncbi:MAG: agarase [Chloroflexi bacterium]|nr:agarase [Chloroflexota bacterium]
MYFKLEKIKNKWWFISPSGDIFFSIGLNHFDPSTMRYPENISIWKEKYNSDVKEWLKNSVSINMNKWRFNTIGWVQDVTIRNFQHSRGFTREEYNIVNLPYCHMLPFTESHQWEKHNNHYDILNSEWEDWCDYVARTHVTEMSDDPNLIGYFYSDCPTWVHTRPVNEWRGPIFDPDFLNSKSGSIELSKLANHYYKTTYESIKRYDKNHLILGDRYEATEKLPDEVINAALPYVDVLSFQDFKNPVANMLYWYKKTDKPVILADSAKIKWDTLPGEISYNDGQWYSEILSDLQDNPGCVGFHLCGGYQRNRSRRYGLIDEQEIPDEKNLPKIIKANEKNMKWVEENSK